MLIIPFDNQPLEDRCVELDGEGIDKNCFAGQDSVVFKDVRNNNAIHVYGNGVSLDRIVGYAKCVNHAEEFLKVHPFEETATFDETKYNVQVYVNPIADVGEKEFSAKNRRDKRVYSVSPFIDGSSLCWPGRSDDKEQLEVAKCFNILFYDRLNEYMLSKSGLGGVDIHPVNVKYRVDKEQKRITLIITDLAKDINIVYMK